MKLADIIKKQDPLSEVVSSGLIKCADLLKRTDGCVSDKKISKAEKYFLKSSDCFNKYFLKFQNNYTELIESEEYDELIRLCDEFSKNLERLNESGRSLGFYSINAVKALESEIVSIKGSSFIAQKDYSSALKLYDASLKRNKHSGSTWIGRGICLIEFERYKEAIRSIDKGIAAEEDSQRGWFCKGVAYLRSNRYERALEAFEEEISGDA